MDLNTNKCGLKLLSICLFGTAAFAYGGTMGPVAMGPGNIYLGVFGGGGSISGTDIRQLGTAFYSEAQGGPLAVNAFGKSKSHSMGMVGGHIGYSWNNILGEHFQVTPSVELEGYYIGGAKIEGHDISNDAGGRLIEHDFLIHYPLESGVFLVNAVLNSKNQVFGTFQPYVGVGIGTAVVSISGANSTQLRPAEPGLNHYNSDPNSSSVAFAAQPKIGVQFDFNNIGIFAEYRYLYLSRTNYNFGSTIAPGHVATSPWIASIKSQSYNVGTVGVNFDL